MGGMPSSFDALPFLVPAYTLMPMLLPWAGCKLRCALVLDVDEEVEPIVNRQSMPMVRFFRLRHILGPLLCCMMEAAFAWENGRPCRASAGVKPVYTEVGGPVGAGT